MWACTLLSLVNVPALVVVGYLGLYLFTNSSLPLSPGFLGAWVALVSLVGAMFGNLFLYRAVRRAHEHLRVALRDCSDQQSQLRSLFDTAADGILTFDEQGMVCSVNYAACRMFGYDPDGLLHQPITRVLPGAGPVGSSTVTAGTNEQKIFGLSNAVEGIHRVRGKFPVSVGISKVRLAGRAVYTTIIHDLSPLYRARQAAESGSRAKSRFLVHMSHELRTPLNGILGMAEALRDALGPEQQPHLGMLEASAEGLLGLVEQVLDYSRLETGELTLQQQTFNLRHLVREVMSQVRLAARAKNLHLAHEIQSDLPDLLLGDPDRLRQVLRSLLDNAVKFTAQGEVVLRVQQINSPTTTANHSASVVFVVSDQGIGIPPAQRERIFQPFEQGDNSSSRAHGGLGLGLSIASRLAELMGGKLSVESVEGRGSIFRLALRLEPAGSDTPGDKGDSGRRSALVVLTDENAASARLN